MTWLPIATGIAGFLAGVFITYVVMKLREAFRDGILIADDIDNNHFEPKP